MKGTGRHLNTIVAAFLGSLVIPIYLLRLMADGRKLQQGLRARNAFGAGAQEGTTSRVFE